jgi:NH3-dependent NAD+ synthetase
METIEDVISRTYIETERVFIEKKKIESFDEQTNKYLDKILELTKNFQALNSIYAKTNAALEEFVSNNSDEKYLNSLYELCRPLLKSSLKLYKSVRSSSYYPGLKSTIKAYHEEAEFLRELNHDMKLKIKLNSNDQLSKILRKAS